MAGEMGEVAQLKSQLAFSGMWANGIVTLSAFGYMTGENSGNMPKKSFIIPMPNTKEGYIAIPYDKLEPYATPMALLSDLVNGLRDDVLSQGQYEKYMAEMMFSLGMATTNKSFQQGLVDTAAIFNVQNFTEGTIQSVAGQVGGGLYSQVPFAGGAVGGLTRMVTDWAQPYKSIDFEEGNPFGSLGAKFRSRFFGGLGNPIQYDELNGEPKVKAAAMGKTDNYFTNVLSAALGEALVPGHLQDAPRETPSNKR